MKHKVGSFLWETIKKKFGPDLTEAYFQNDHQSRPRGFASVCSVCVRERETEEILWKT